MSTTTIRRTRPQLSRAVETSRNGATVELQIGTVTTAISLLKDLEKIELNHTHPEEHP